MHTVSEIVIAAEPSAIYALASRTERWAELLPHYRFVRVKSESAGSRIVEMGARRGPIPISWTALQTNDARTPHIAFRHILGWTRGMDVEWIFEPVGAATRVRIEHRLAFAFPVAAEWLGENVVGRYFVQSVAAKTLACMKRLAESR